MGQAFSRPLIPLFIFTSFAFFCSTILLSSENEKPPAPDSPNIENFLEDPASIEKLPKENREAFRQQIADEIAAAETPPGELEQGGHSKAELDSVPEPTERRKKLTKLLEELDRVSALTVGQGAKKPELEFHIPEGKKTRQIERRGWTDDIIKERINNPLYTRPTIDAKTNEAATAYYGSDGSYVVRHDKTGRIVQMSDRGDGTWIDPDGNFRILDNSVKFKNTEKVTDADFGSKVYKPEPETPKQPPSDSIIVKKTVKSSEIVGSSQPEVRSDIVAAHKKEIQRRLANGESLDPIRVIDSPDGKGLMIVDGNHRYQAMKELGIADQVPVQYYNPSLAKRAGLYTKNMYQPEIVTQFSNGTTKTAAIPDTPKPALSPSTSVKAKIGVGVGIGLAVVDVASTGKGFEDEAKSRAHLYRTENYQTLFSPGVDAVILSGANNFGKLLNPLVTIPMEGATPHNGYDKSGYYYNGLGRWTPQSMSEVGKASKEAAASIADLGVWITRKSNPYTSTVDSWSWFKDVFLDSNAK